MLLPGFLFFTTLLIIVVLKSKEFWDFPGCQWVRLHAPNAGGLGLIPRRGTRSHTHAATKSSHAATRSLHAATKRSHMLQRRSCMPQLGPSAAKISQSISQSLKKKVKSFYQEKKHAAISSDDRYLYLLTWKS